jgi:CHAT domain-containing protein
MILQDLIALPHLAEYRHIQTGVRTKLADAYLLRGADADASSAVHLLDEALELNEAVVISRDSPTANRDYAIQRHEWGAIKVGLARAEMAREDGDATANRALALAAVQDGLSVFESSKSDPAIDAYAVQASVYAGSSNWGGAKDALVNGLEHGDSLFDLAITDEAKEARTTTTALIYQRLVEACLHLGSAAEEILGWIEQSRSRLLRDQLASLPLPAPYGHENDLLLAREQQMLDDLRSLQRAGEREPEPDRRHAIVDRQARIHRERADLWEQIRAESAEMASYVALRKGEQFNIDDVRSWLAVQPARAGLVEFFTTSVGVIAVVVRPDAQDGCLITIDLSESELERMSTRCEREVHRYDPEWPLDETWQDLARPLMLEILPKLADVDVVYLVPHGRLHKVPLHAIEVAGSTLLHEAAVVYAPSAMVARRLWLSETADNGNRSDSLVVGNPTGDLGHATTEALAVARCLSTDPLIGPDATRSAVLARLKTASTAHFACHAYFDPDDPFASAIELSDGPLTARELVQYNVALSRLVLSGCETGTVDVREGDELYGLARAFLYAGAKTLIATLWPVYDPATEEVMVNMYEQLNESPLIPVQYALRESMLMARNRGLPTNAWAPFVVVGAAQ